jgi:hypothetical protein
MAAQVATQHLLASGSEEEAVAGLKNGSWPSQGKGVPT